jgi:ribosomal-protein-alanine N-acetyltransferase
LQANTGIRLIEISDAEVIAAHRVRDREAFARWEPAMNEDFYTVEGQQRRIAALLADHRAGDRWPAVVTEEGEVVGQITVSTILRGPLQKGYLGYWIATTHHGRGHATRAVGLVLRVMFEELQLHRAEAHVQLDNLPSQHVLHANGFTPYGIAHDHIFIDGAWRDEILWERTLA